MNFKNIIKYIRTLLLYFFPMYLVTVGISWILLHIYLRFVTYKSSYTLAELKPHLTEKHYFFFLAFIVIHMFYLITVCIILYRQKFPQDKPYKIFNKLTEKINAVLDFIYWKPLDYIHDLIAPHIPMSARFFIYVEKIWATKEEKYFYQLIILFEVLPKLLISITFLIEIILYGRIKVFLYIIGLIFITIFWHIFLKLFASCGTRNASLIKNYFLTIKGVGNPTIDSDGIPIAYTSYEFVVKEEYEDVIDPEEEALLFMQLMAMPRFVEQIKKDTNKITPYITLLTSLIYVAGGIYRFIYFIM